jgi:hypothetical protein
MQPKETPARHASAPTPTQLGDEDSRCQSSRRKTLVFADKIEMRGMVVYDHDTVTGVCQ